MFLFYAVDLLKPSNSLSPYPKISVHSFFNQPLRVQSSITMESRAKSIPLPRPKISGAPKATASSKAKAKAKAKALAEQPPPSSPVAPKRRAGKGK